MKKNGLIIFKVSNEEKALIESRAKAIGISVSTYARLVIFNKINAFEKYIPTPDVNKNAQN